MALITAWLGPQPLTDAAAHWFAPSSTTYTAMSGYDGTTDYFAINTAAYDGSAPYQAALTRTRVDFFGNVVVPTGTVATYDTGTHFSVAASRVFPGKVEVFFTKATPGAAAGASDIDVARYDGFGTPAGSPVTLVSGVTGFQQLRTDHAPISGGKYVVAYSTFDASSHAEAINLRAYDAYDTLIATTTLDSFTTGNGLYDGFGFGTLSDDLLSPHDVYLVGYQLGGRYGVQYQAVDNGARTGTPLFVAPLTPTGSTDEALGSWSWTRLDPGSNATHDLAIVMPFAYTDASGRHYAIDVRLLNAGSGSGVGGTVALAQSSEANVALTRMPNGLLMVGYVDNGTGYLREYNNDGTVVGGSSFAMPGTMTDMRLSSLGDGRVLVEFPQATSGGNQLFYAIYDTRQSGLTFSDFGDQEAGLAGTVYNDAFIVTGYFNPDIIVGAGGTDFILTDDAAGNGTVLADLKDGVVSKGGHLDARLYGIQGVTTGSDPTVVMGLTTGVDLVFGGHGDLTVYNEGATDYIRGGSGHNAVVGAGGTSIFFGTGGSDTMRGGSGQNFMQAGPTGSSTDVFYGTGGTDFVYGGPGSTSLIGGSGTEVLTAGAGTNQLVGSNTSGGALDILNGGTGTDVFYAGVGTNLLYEATGTDVLAGNAGTDYVYGGAGRSFVYGGTGTQVITTGAGNQYVRAGSGSTFFNDTAANLTAGRFDRIDNFAGGAGTNLYLPTAVQGATAFLAQDGGTAVLTVVGRGVAEIFAGGADPGTVQAHTHFTL